MSVDTLLKKDKEGTLFKEAYELQGKTNFQGLKVDIENAKGSVREGTNADGSKWKTVFKVPYGYIRGTKGADGEEVDAYVGPEKAAPNAFVVHQKKDDGSYDEDTVMLGFLRRADAKKAILQHYDDPKYVGGIHAVPMERLKKILSSNKQLTKISNFVVAMSDPGLRIQKEQSTVARAKSKPGDVPSIDGNTVRSKVESNQTNLSSYGIDKSAAPPKMPRYLQKNQFPDIEPSTDRREDRLSDQNSVQLTQNTLPANMR